MEDEKTVRELHREAMNTTMDAMLTYRTTGWTRELHFQIREAYLRELEAADRFEAIPANEPTRSILLRSAAILGLMAGEPQAAKNLAQRAMEGTPQSRDIETLTKILNGDINCGNVWKT